MMDRIIAAYPAEDDGDLMLCHADGVAWQKDMTVTAKYDADYFSKCRGYEGQPIAEAISEGRIALVERHFGDGPLLDVGVGSGEFVRKRGKNTFGYDVNPEAEFWLRKEGRWSSAFTVFKAFTFWDVIEHVPEPDDYLDRVVDGSYVFACLPVFADLRLIRESKHYRPGEHLYYFTRRGFISWMRAKGFRHLETAWHEVAAGRDSIVSFAFRRGLA